ncbi:MAG TPA: hypothetical protein VLF60_03780 [Candidatus Saccharimonadales bacterium]|nr:hypothetical protein [Candidatus Saccharimonadales bacterium]
MSKDSPEFQPPAPPARVLQRPELPFSQEEFNGTVELSEEERGYVNSAFATTVDRVFDRARDEGVHIDRSEDHFDDDEYAEDVYMIAADGRTVNIDTHYAKDGTVMGRTIIIFWDWDDPDNKGMTRYTIHYTEKNPTVRREDDHGYLSVGEANWSKSYVDRAEADEAEVAHGFNYQSITTEEMNGLAGYIEAATPARY